MEGECNGGNYNGGKCTGEGIVMEGKCNGGGLLWGKITEKKL